MQSNMTYQATIDPDAIASELAESWINGNKNDVIKTLSTDHPALTALVLLDRVLMRPDRNEITNRLIDHRVDTLRSIEE